MTATRPDLCQILFPDHVDDERPLVIIIGGSSGGLRSLDQAEFYRDQGYPSAVIPYFGMEGLHDELKLIPLEHFRDCVTTITSEPLLEDRKVYVQGTSKGAEATLLLCSKGMIEVDGIILISPSRYIWGAAADLDDLISGRTVEQSSWSWADAPVPFVPFDPDNPLPPITRNIEGTDCFVFKDTWYPKIKGPEGAIDLNDWSTPAIIFSGQQDDLWPSDRAALEIADGIAAGGHSSLVRHVSFPNVGHQIPFPGKEPSLVLTHPQLGYALSYGGQREATINASEVWWEETQRFLASDRL
ncbi:MAG: acyl-CoA thioester hydrolase/BAAT C-terminal domain-containing protein [Pseudomonadota bacterium]